jgi:acylpyruvate hydrolase
MRLATIRTPSGTAAVRVDDDDDQAVEVGASDVGELLRDPAWRARAGGADGTTHRLAGMDYAPLIPRPDKIICVGLNYRTHILEMGRSLPDYPTLFAKYSSALIGANDPIVLPDVSPNVDWEAELAVIIGAPVRHASAEDARSAIAGYSVLNDVTARDWQNRTLQWLQGKTFESTTPLGPMLVTADEPGAADGHVIECEVSGEVMQHATTGDLVFDPVALVRYISTIFTLMPGDVISTGTPDGVGHARKPPRYLSDGDVVVTRIAGIGECRNPCQGQIT